MTCEIINYLSCFSSPLLRFFSLTNCLQPIRGGNRKTNTIYNLQSTCGGKNGRKPPPTPTTNKWILLLLFHYTPEVIPRPSTENITKECDSLNMLLYSSTRPLQHPSAVAMAHKYAMDVLSLSLIHLFQCEHVEFRILLGTPSLFRC